MSHSSELLASIQRKIENDYPPNQGFSYLIEQRLVRSKRNFYPDIQVLEEGKVVCAVEIGYTRPEKLSWYQKHGIEDIRWYGKDGKLHKHVVRKPASRAEKFRRHCVSVVKMDRTRLMTVPEAGAKYFGLGRGASYAAAARGQIPTLRVGRRYFVSIEAIERMIAAGGTDYRDEILSGR